MTVQTLSLVKIISVLGQLATNVFVVMGIYPVIQNLVKYILYVASVYLTTLDKCVGFIALK
jgi:hypothetical protein